MTTSRTTTDNAATVADIYAAFGRGHVPAVLDRLAADVTWEEWDDNFSQSAAVPHLAARQGSAGVAEHFALLGSYTVQDFAVLDIIGTGRQVVAGVRGSLDLPGAGRMTDEELHSGCSTTRAAWFASGTTSTPQSTSRPRAGEDTTAQ